MNPSSFRPISHIELVVGASDVNSFEREIAQGRLGTTTGQEIHAHSSLEWNHKKLWLAVVGRAAKDHGEIEMDDLEVEDTPDADIPLRNMNALGDRYDAKFDASEWWGSGDYKLVMEFVGLEPVADTISKMAPDEIVANLREFEKREELERKGRRK